MVRSGSKAFVNELREKGGNAGRHPQKTCFTFIYKRGPITSKLCHVPCVVSLLSRHGGGHYRAVRCGLLLRTYTETHSLPLSIYSLLYNPPAALCPSAPSPLSVCRHQAFMVGDKVEVVSRSYDEAEPGHVWTSTGSGSYTIDTTTDVRQPLSGL